MDFSILNSVCSAVFGDACTYTPASTGVGVALTVIWGEDESAEQKNRAAKAMAFAILTDFAAAPLKGDEITKAGKVYKVAEDPKDGLDGIGGVTLILRYVRDTP